MQRQPTRTTPQPVPFEQQPNSALIWALLQDTIKLADQLDAYRQALALIAAGGVDDPAKLAAIVLQDQET